MSTTASRDTSTGLDFEKRVILNKSGINVTKHNMYRYLESKGIDWTKLLSRKLLPDEAFYDETTKELSIYEKKFQKTDGSADENRRLVHSSYGSFLRLVKQLVQLK